MIYKPDDHLTFIWERLYKFHNEDPDRDYMCKLKEIIEWLEKHPHLYNFWDEKNRKTHQILASEEGVKFLETCMNEYRLLKCAENLRGTPTPPSPTTPHSSELALPPAGSSSVVRAATLLEALAALTNSSDSLSLSLTTASGLWNFTYEALPSTPATGSEPPDLNALERAHNADHVTLHPR